MKPLTSVTIVICASIGFLLLASTSNAATIHVDSSAIGPGDGSLSRPFRTINRAVVMASPGDTLIVKSGSYPEKLAVRKQLTIIASGGPVVIEGRVFVRLDIRSLNPNGPEISALRRGFRVMLGRDPTDPTSLIYQANIHGTFDSPSRPAWNTCEHGSFYFLSWHRMYLYFFERILRAASGDPFLVLPYWNYSDPNARQLPLPFREPQDSSNPLFITQRSSVINNGGSLPESSVTFLRAFALTNFDSPPDSGNSFGGQRVTPRHSGFPHSVFENTPHDDVHTNVGGNGGWMSSFEFAARDPIFWLHHANIDRLWKRWLDQGGGRSNPADSAWLNTRFEFFDETGQRRSLSGQEILNTVDLNYMYDDEPPATLAITLTPKTAAKPKIAAEPMRRQQKPLATSAVPAGELGREPVTLSINLSREAERKIKAVTEPKEALITLNIEGIEFDQIPGGHYEIYINLPQGMTPNYESNYYVGNLSFFGIKPRGEQRHRAHGAERAIYSYDITNVVRNLLASGSWIKGRVKVTFVKQDVIPPPGTPSTEVKVEPVVPVTIRRVTITTE